MFHDQTVRFADCNLPSRQITPTQAECIAKLKAARAGCSRSPSRWHPRSPWHPCRWRLLRLCRAAPSPTAATRQS
jgi:hypothetical protein